MKIEERRKKVAELYGTKTQAEIAKELGVAEATVSLDVSYLASEGVIAKREHQLRAKEEERRKRVAELYSTKTQAEIARELGISQSTVSLDISYLLSEGVIAKRKHQSRAKEERAKIEKRRKRVAELYGTKTQAEIARELGVSERTINLDISCLVSEGIIAKRSNQLETKEERRKKVAELYGTKTQAEIAKELGVCNATISKDIKDLLSEGVIATNKKSSGSAEKKYINMMLKKIKEFADKKDIEMAIKYLETLQGELSPSEGEQLNRLMRFLQKYRINSLMEKNLLNGEGRIKDNKDTSDNGQER